jgi:anthranilate synthase component I
MQYFPSREDFHLLSIAHTVVPVWTEVLADMETPVARVG